MAEEFGADSLLELYLYESSSLLDSLDDILLDAEAAHALNKENINEIFRIMHTIKGSSAMMEHGGISSVAHNAEDMFAIVRDAGLPENRFDDVMDLVLAVSDFFKNEVNKIQQGEPLEENVAVLVDTLKALADQLRQGVTEPPPIDIGRMLGEPPGKPPTGQIETEPETKMPEPPQMDTKPVWAGAGPARLAERPEPPSADPEPASVAASGKPSAGQYGPVARTAELIIPEPPQAPEGGRILGLPDGYESGSDEFFASKDLSRFERPAADSEEPTPNEDTFFIHVFFNEGSRMENIRAFMLVNKLNEKGTVNRTVPSELENSPEAALEIAENGFYISYTSGLFKEQIEAIAKGTLSVETVSFLRKMPEAPSEEEFGFRIGEMAEDIQEPASAPQTIDGLSPPQAPFSIQSTAPPADETGYDARPGAYPEEATHGLSEVSHILDAHPGAYPEAAPAPEERDEWEQYTQTAETSEAAPHTSVTPAPPPASTEPSQPDGKRGKQNIISVDLTKLDTLLDLVGEIVIHESLVTENPDLEGLETPNFDKSARELDKLTNELQDTVMAIRMIPVSSSFHRMRRIVRDMGRALGKEAELITVGESTEVDKTILDAISDPLMHLVRNAMDHAIESADDRAAAGKAPSGHITLSAVNSGSDVIISVTDDGRGLDIDAIMSKAKERGLLRKPESEYSEKEIYNLLMVPGFSTRSSATEYSGRGVGMDVVKSNIEKIGGTVLIESKKGRGTNVMLKIPLTLAIISCMEVRLGDDVYSIPVSNIREALKADSGQLITDPNGNEMILLRGEPYPIVRLYEVFGKQGAIEEVEDGILVLVASEDRKACLLSDELIGKFQVVAKPLPPYLGSFNISRAGISGCTILGNGEVSLIVNTQELLG
ncbi:MAG: chemotaxis protein CheW [Clostridiales Family XIII bacterium]|jgi:chemotaxis protein histidine kinase CheA|nr:chemotaxis protein CheW [Clostridiales Family XIII bacterium]